MSGELRHRGHKSTSDTGPTPTVENDASGDASVNTDSSISSSSSDDRLFKEGEFDEFGDTAGLGTVAGKIPDSMRAYFMKRRAELIEEKQRTGVLGGGEGMRMSTKLDLLVLVLCVCFIGGLLYTEYNINVLEYIHRQLLAALDPTPKELLRARKMAGVGTTVPPVPQ